MLVQYTPVAALPPDVRARLTQYVQASPMLRMDNQPALFEGYHISRQEIEALYLATKTQNVKPLFG